MLSVGLSVCNYMKVVWQRQCYSGVDMQIEHPCLHATTTSPPLQGLTIVKGKWHTETRCCSCSNCNGFTTSFALFGAKERGEAFGSACISGSLPRQTRRTQPKT